MLGCKWVDGGCGPKSVFIDLDLDLINMESICWIWIRGENETNEYDFGPKIRCGVHYYNCIKQLQKKYIF